MPCQGISFQACLALAGHCTRSHCIDTRIIDLALLFLRNIPYFRLKGGWLTFWVTAACVTDMALFGYDRGVFGQCILIPREDPVAH